MATNGNLPTSALTRVGPGSLEHEAAAAFIAMQNEARARGLAVPQLAGPNSGFRSCGMQHFFWNCFQQRISGRGCSCSNGCALAARPCTSNHGWGRAADLQTPAQRRTVDLIGAKYGWRKIEAFSEWWHVNYVGGFKLDCHKTLQRGCTGSRVRKLQSQLRRLGNKGLKADGDYGARTYGYVRNFQRNHHLVIDGVAGPNTQAAIAKAVAQKVR